MQVCCPWCGEEVVLSGSICPSCRHEVLAEHLEGGNREEASLENGGEWEHDAPDERDRGLDVAEEWLEKYNCPRCGHHACRVNEVAMTGAGLSKLLDIQHHHYLFVSCLQCGGVEIFDPNVLEARKRGMLGTGLDFLF
ncbi:zinc ribbon domain-containing protein [Paenibacillus soyae]|uniref:zinc ribbon domain-containing protein n=1 Tax=Paenibacillus soyae TaxID=2969249 RepID=UPI0027D46446|nr:zinc ribbon domain-containing protein [Paenibacillus soyae]